MITAQQRQARSLRLGSSDAAAILGLDPWRNAADIALDKRGLLAPSEPNAAMMAGTVLEVSVLDWCENEIQKPLSRHVWLSRDEFPHFCANIDAETDDKEIIEAKTSTTPDEWGEPGTAEIPHHVTVQTHWQFLCGGDDYRTAYVPVLLPLFGRFDFRLYRVERSDELCDELARRGLDFWYRHVVEALPVPDQTPHLETLKRVRRVPATTAEVPDAVRDFWIAARAARLQAEKDERDAEADLLAALGTAEGDAMGVLTYYEQSTKRLDGKLLAKELPDIAEKYQAVSTYRVLRLKAAKGKR